MPTENSYTAPGIYIEEISSFRPEIPILESTVPAFIGSTASGQFPLLPKKIISLLDYTEVFGDAGTLFPFLQLYFDNGGGECFVINTEPKDFIHALDVLKEMQEPTLIVIPQMTSLPKPDYVTLIRATLAHCAASSNRFVILDVYAATEFNVNIIVEHRSDVGEENLRFGASYFPFIVRSTTGQMVPASPAIAGIYCKTDREKGIWKSPAKIALNSVRAPALSLNQQQQELLNIDPATGKSINAIRWFEGRGTLVWGARTLAGNDNEWRYITVQRLCSWVKSCIEKGLQPLAFEENNNITWIKARGMIENFLTNLWRQGALTGTKTDEAFFVHAGVGQTMTQRDIDEGRLIVEVGLAAVRPAEFLVLRIAQPVATNP